MHIFRSGSSAADLGAVDPNMIGYIQIADVRMKPTIPNYMEEACFERMAIGTGEVPLFEFLSVLPRHLVIGIEAPIRSQAEAGIGPRERLAPSVKAARDLLARLDG
jgi:sugar phosphate isomerase/epimerase